MKIPDFDFRLLIQILFVLLGTTASSGAEDRLDYRNLADQLDELAYEHKFVIDGLELAASKPARWVSGDSTEQVKRLLAEFNYVSVLSSGQTIERIIILGEKQVIARGITVSTTKRGKNHTIEGRITGPNGKQVKVSLVIDTGADYLVLPKSMMKSFGIDPDSTAIRELQTANGLIKARVAKVETLQIANELITDIEAAFIPDDQLGDTKLLGMNVLQRYRVTLDDRAKTITLIKVE